MDSLLTSIIDDRLLTCETVFLNHSITQIAQKHSYILRNLKERKALTGEADDDLDPKQLKEIKQLLNDFINTLKLYSIEISKGEPVTGSQYDKSGFDDGLPPRSSISLPFLTFSLPNISSKSLHSPFYNLLRNPLPPIQEFLLRHPRSSSRVRHKVPPYFLAAGEEY